MMHNQSSAIRTTVSLEPDVFRALERAVAEGRFDATRRAGAGRRPSAFKLAINEALRRGLRESPAIAPTKIELPSFDMGAALVDLTKALSLATELDDQDIIAKLRAGK